MAKSSGCVAAILADISLIIWALVYEDQSGIPVLTKLSRGLLSYLTGFVDIAFVILMALSPIFPIFYYFEKRRGVGVRQFLAWGCLSGLAIIWSHLLIEDFPGSICEREDWLSVVECIGLGLFLRPALCAVAVLIIGRLWPRTSQKSRVVADVL